MEQSTLTGKVKYRYHLVFLPLIFIEQWLKLLHLPFVNLLSSITYLGLGITYLFWFFSKKKKGLLDRIKLALVLLPVVTWGIYALEIPEAYLSLRPVVILLTIIWTLLERAQDLKDKNKAAKTLSTILLAYTPVYYIIIRPMFPASQVFQIGFIVLALLYCYQYRDYLQFKVVPKNDGVDEIDSIGSGE